MKTKFIKICRSGPSIDGRTIKKKWLTDCAEKYDPELYTAVINLEHETPSFGFGSYGTVSELKTETIPNSDEIILLASLEPNARMLSICSSNRSELFTSAEIQPNFRGAGHSYLTGLALTSTPASTSTEKVRLSQNNAGDGELHLMPTEQINLSALELPASSPSNIINKLVNFLKQNGSEEDNKEINQEINKALFKQHNNLDNDDMDTQKLAAMQEQLNTLQQQIEKLSTSTNTSAPTNAAHQLAATLEPQLKNYGITLNIEAAETAEQKQIRELTERLNKIENKEQQPEPAAAQTVEQLSQQVQQIAETLAVAMGTEQQPTPAADSNTTQADAGIV